MTTFDDLPTLDVKRLLGQYGLKPKKSLGQNFLSQPKVLKKIVKAAGITPTDTVLEVGPGLGNLTRYLAIAAKNVVAVELDQRFLPPLEEVLAPFDNVKVIHGDILDLNPADLFTRADYLVVANIPYYITSALIRHLLESGMPPTRLVLTVQEEVAQRMIAEPGQMNLLALSVQVYGEVSIPARIPKGAFYPVPNVDSAVVRVDRFTAPKIAPDSLEVFFKLIKAGFGQKRKTLRNALSAGLAVSKDEVVGMLEAAEIDPMRRAQSLSLEEWSGLVAAYKDIYEV